MFLTPDELVTLTGYKRPADQVRWLERNGVPHWINAQGRPVVRQDMRQPSNAPQLGHVS